MKKVLAQTLIILLFLILAGLAFFIYQLQSEETRREELSQKITIKESPVLVGEVEEKKEETVKETSQLQPASFGILLSATQLEQGDTLIITADNVPKGEKITGTFDGQLFDFLPAGTGGKWIGLVGIDAKKAPGKYTLSVNISGKPKIQKTITIKKADFSITEIVITPELEEKGYTPSNIAENITTKDGVIISEVLQKYTPEGYFSQSFVYPLRALKDVGAFGNIRKKGDIIIQHLGVDLDAEERTPVSAVNDGVVTFAQELIVFGKTIIIDHGLGIYSLYLHLSEFTVSEGDRVKRGEIIGLSGSTGWSAGPHLHLSMKVKGASVDPLKFIKTVAGALK